MFQLQNDINTVRLVCYDKIVYQMIHGIINNKNNNNKFSQVSSYSAAVFVDFVQCH